MAITLEEADAYFEYHDSWFNHLERESALNRAEKMILALYGDKLTDEAMQNVRYSYAVYEQALHLVEFSKERYRLQLEGVTTYKVDDVSFNMSQSLVSPTACALLKTLLKKRVGRTV